MKHLTISDRLMIEQGIQSNLSFRTIAHKIKKSPSTISREVLSHREKSTKGAVGRIKNCCIYRNYCNFYHICQGRRCRRKCSACYNCNANCDKFKEDICRKLSIPPYVCNGCNDEHKCVLNKMFYLHSVANKEYTQMLFNSRKGANLTENEKLYISNIIHAGIQKGQSVHHILASNKDFFNICEKTIYRYVNAGIIRTKRGDMPRSCSMKPRRNKNLEHKVDKKCRINRSKDDFEKYCNLYPDMPVVEIDSVLGEIGGKVLLTIQFNNCGLMLAFIREANTSASVIDIFDMLEEKLSFETFKRLFQIILTDNGSEFSNPRALEESPFLHQERTKIFYCDPCASWQKGHIENNHINLRKILPKGSSFNKLTQDDINLVVSHINSFSRKSLNDIPAITLFETLYGKEILSALNIKLIDSNLVCLMPELVKK